MTDEQNEKKGRPVALDATATSADPKLPAFLAPPEGAPVYHGFPVLQNVEVDGFLLGKITDFEAEASEYGDAFVVAPDGSPAGLVWEISEEPQFSEVCAEDVDRWGVWAVNFPYPMHRRKDARRNLEVASCPQKEMARMAKTQGRKSSHIRLACSSFPVRCEFG